MQYSDVMLPTNLKGFSVIQHVAGVIHSIDSEVKESTSWAKVEVEWDKMTLNKPICVSIQVVVHHKTCTEISRKHLNNTKC